MLISGKKARKKTPCRQKKVFRWFRGKVKKVVVAGIGFTVLSGSISLFTFSPTVNLFNYHDERVTNVHNHVVDNFRTSVYVDEFGNRPYKVHPSRYGSLRYVEFEVTEGVDTSIIFYSQ